MKRFLPGVLMFLCAGCGVEPPDPAPTAPETAQAPAELVARVERDNGNVVEFYELTDGEVVVMEEGVYPNPPAPIHGAGPAEAWSKLTGRTDVPTQLGIAQQRFELLRANAPRDSQAAPERGVSSTREAPPAGGTHAAAYAPCDINWFQDNFCNGSYDWKVCLTNWWNGAYAYSTGAEYHYTAVCPFYGNVTLNIQNQLIRNVGAGGYLWAWRSGSNFYYRADVQNASGDGFHFSARVNH